MEEDPTARRMKLAELTKIKSTAEELLESLKSEPPLSAETCRIEQKLLQALREYNTRWELEP